jgi:hypothetical protein
MKKASPQVLMSRLLELRQDCPQGSVMELNQRHAALIARSGSWQKSREAIFKTRS